MGDKGVHTFPMGSSLKVNIIAQLGSELAYLEATVQYFRNKNCFVFKICSFVLLFYWHIKLLVLFNVKSILLEER